MKKYKMTKICLSPSLEENYINNFLNNINETISNLQNKGYEVEVQYSPCYQGDGFILSALILGYVEK